MAATLDQATVYTGAGGSQTDHLGTTTGTVASGALIVLLVHRFHSGGGGTYTATGGGLTWVSVNSVTSGNIGIYMFAAFAPSGLASGTTNFGVTSGGTTNNDYTVCAASYLGLDSSGGAAGAITAFGGAATGSSTAWGTGTIGGNSGDAYIGGAGGDGTLRTSTPTAPAVERIDFNSGTSGGSITLVDNLSGGASDNLAGTWSGTLTNVAVGGAFKVAGGGGGGTTVKQLSALGVG